MLTYEDLEHIIRAIEGPSGGQWALHQLTDSYRTELRERCREAQKTAPSTYDGDED